MRLILTWVGLQEGMLARFAAALQRGQIQAVAGQGFGGGGGTIVVNDNDNCLVSSVIGSIAYLSCTPKSDGCPISNSRARCL